MSNSFITRRSSQTTKTITFDGFAEGLTHEAGTDGVSKWFNAPDLSVASGRLLATHVGDYAIFNIYTNYEAYNASLEKTHLFYPSNFAVERGAATHVGNYALFAGGGTSNSYYSSVSAISSSLEQVTPFPESLSQAREELAATHVGNYALFGGGSRSGPQYNIVDAYNASLERSTPTPLSQSRSELSATHVGNYALFAGGENGDYYSPLSTVDAYNTSLERSTLTPLSQARSYLAATHVGDYALFGGGSINYSNGTASVEIYTTPAQKTKITLPPNVSYTFGSLTGTTTQPTEISPDYPLFGTVTVS